MAIEVNKYDAKKKGTHSNLRKKNSENGFKTHTRTHTHMHACTIPKGMRRYFGLQRFDELLPQISVEDSTLYVDAWGEDIIEFDCAVACSVHMDGFTGHLYASLFEQV